MLAIIIIVMDGVSLLSRRFDRGEVTIGSATDNDIVLQAPEISAHHARVLVEGDQVAIIDLDSETGTRVNGEHVSSGSELPIAGRRDAVQMGAFVLNIFIESSETESDEVQTGLQPLRQVGLSKTERELLQLVSERPEDNEPRLVYADWLGERGDPRGELIALQCDTNHDEHVERRIQQLQTENAGDDKARSAPKNVGMRS